MAINNESEKLKVGDKVVTSFNEEGCAVIRRITRKRKGLGYQGGYSMDAEAIPCSKCRRGPEDILDVSGAWFMPYTKKQYPDAH